MGLERKRCTTVTTGAKPRAYTTVVQDQQTGDCSSRIDRCGSTARGGRITRPADYRGESSDFGAEAYWIRSGFVQSRSGEINSQRTTVKGGITWGHIAGRRFISSRGAAQTRVDSVGRGGGKQCVSVCLGQPFPPDVSSPCASTSCTDQGPDELDVYSLFRNGNPRERVQRRVYLPEPGRQRAFHSNGRYTLLADVVWSAATDQGSQGVQLWLAQHLRPKVNAVEAVNAKILSASVTIGKGGGRSRLLCIVAHAPTECAKKCVKEEFWSALDMLMTSRKPTIGLEDTLVLIDANAGSIGSSAIGHSQLVKENDSSTGLTMWWVRNDGCWSKVPLAVSKARSNCPGVRKRTINCCVPRSQWDARTRKMTLICLCYVHGGHQHWMFRVQRTGSASEHFRRACSSLLVWIPHFGKVQSMKPLRSSRSVFRPLPPKPSVTFRAKKKKHWITDDTWDHFRKVSIARRSFLDLGSSVTLCLVTSFFPAWKGEVDFKLSLQQYPSSSSAARMAMKDKVQKQCRALKSAKKSEEKHVAISCQCSLPA